MYSVCDSARIYSKELISDQNNLSHYHYNNSSLSTEVIYMADMPFFNTQLISKYNTSAPRYTSYPTALEFSSDFQRSDLINAIEHSHREHLSLYIHIPFCHSLCYYCGCNKVITRHRDKADIYLEYLAQEIRQQAPLFRHKKVIQLHLGGGTPSFLTHEQLTQLVGMLQVEFSLDKNAEMSIEIDPREITLSLADHLYSLGFNRLSLGVQDIDEKVQKAINREQSTEFIAEFIAHAKSIGFESINIDLIYGLPHQTSSTFIRTLEQAQAMDVDRISLFSYAHMPQKFAAQRKLRDEWLPSPDEKFALMQLAIETLCSYGYVFIGMDHFAKPEDELAIAYQAGKLHRNFQGYTTLGDSDLLGLGVSSISHIGNAISQNEKVLKEYYKGVDEKGHALEHGVTLNNDDAIRAYVIKNLMCNYNLNKKAFQHEFSLNFDDYFDTEIINLKPFVGDNLISNNQNELLVKPEARLLIRNICMTFDAYMQKHLNKQRFSRVI